MKFWNLSEWNPDFIWFFHKISLKILFLGKMIYILVEKIYILDPRLGCICLKKDRKRSDLDHYFFLKNEPNPITIIWFFHFQKMSQFLSFFLQKWSRSWSDLDHFRSSNALMGPYIYFFDGRSPSRHKQSFFIYQVPCLIEMFN